MAVKHRNLARQDGSAVGPVSLAYDRRAPESVLRPNGDEMSIEIDVLNGAVVRLGARHGVECPVNQALTMIIAAMERASPS